MRFLLISVALLAGALPGFAQTAVTRTSGVPFVVGKIPYAINGTRVADSPLTRTDASTVTVPALIVGTTNVAGALAEKITGPVVATTDALALFDSTTGKLLKDSVHIVSSVTNLASPGNFTTYTATATNKFRVADGTQTLPSLVFASDDDASGTGFFRVGANSIGVTVNGSTKITISTTALNTVNTLGIGTSTVTPDIVLTPEGSGVLQVMADSATPVALTLKAADGTGTDIAGAPVRLAGGRRTGTGAGGNVFLQTTPSATATGSSAGTLIDRHVVVAKGKVLTDASAVSLFEIALPTLTGTGGKIEARIRCSDGTDLQGFTQSVQFSAVNKGGAYTTSIIVMPTDLVSGLGAKTVSAGTLTTAWTILTGTDKITIQLNADTSLTPSSNAFLVYYTVTNNSEQAVTIL